MKRTAEDWTPEAIRRFWEWQAPRPETQKQYFSRQVGRALARVLRLAGGLRGEVLDFGCGPGYLLQRMCQGGATRAYGVDYSPGSVEETRKRLGSERSFGGAEAIDALPTQFPDGKFDAVTCIETVEHLRDGQLGALLAELLRLMKPGGTAMFTTPCSEDLERAQAYCPFCDSEFHNMQHMRVFSPADLHDTLTAAGFDVKFCEGIDLWRFQPPKGRKLVDYSLRDVVGGLARSVGKGLAATGDMISSRPFPENRAFRRCVKPGPHLVAVAVKPSRG